MSPQVSQPRFMAAVLLLACGWIVFIIALKHLPVADEALATQFKRQQTDLDSLVSILVNNPAISFVQRHAGSNDVLLATDAAGHSLSLHEFGLAAPELRRLFDLVNCNYVSRNSSEIIVGLRRNGSEDLYPGGFKVFAFCSTQPGLIVSSIDDFRRRNRGKYGCYQHLEGSWYIKYSEAH